MSKRQCLSKMENLVTRYVRKDKSNFIDYDVPTINQSSASEFVFIVHESGTWLCKEERVAKFSPYTYCYSDKTARYYHVDTETGEVKKIRDPKAFLSDCLIRHPEWDEMEEPSW